LQFLFQGTGQNDLLGGGTGNDTINFVGYNKGPAVSGPVLQSQVQVSPGLFQLTFGGNGTPTQSVFVQEGAHTVLNFTGDGGNTTLN
jgi:hypothetical protein